MRIAEPTASHTARSEQIILFRAGGQLFAISSSSVQEVRSFESLAVLASEVSQPNLRKVRHVVRRGDRSLYIVNGALHFGLPASPAALVFVLCKTRTALLLDGIEKMAAITRLHALPLAFCHEERRWYRGLASIDQNIVPVVHPDGFLTPEELELLDASLPPATEADSSTGEATELTQ